ncbi:MAG: hypothetical protein GXP63_00515 [DPANN group archaeon]|nr:hypothetical protein [DPANN group archaeon]
MAFDKNLDVKLFSETVEIDDDNRITVGVFSYNEGEKKLQLSRERMNAQGEYSFAKLGRMTKQEAEKVIPAMQKALEFM